MSDARPTAIEIVTESVPGTHAIAAAVGSLIRPGDVILLDGDLGAGKTAFTQGLAKDLGITEPVTSPTFTIVRSYPTNRGLMLYHADLYRLDQLSEVVDLGLPELLEEGAAAVIEWGERGAPAFGPDHLQIEISHGREEEERRLSLTCHGTSWSDRWPELRKLLAGWHTRDAAGVT